jgi:hypothetical protein
MAEEDQGSMLLSQFSEISANFRRRLNEHSIHNFRQSFGRKYLTNHNSGPWCCYCEETGAVAATVVVATCAERSRCVSRSSSKDSRVSWSWCRRKSLRKLWKWPNREDLKKSTHFSWGLSTLGPERAQAEAGSAASGFYYITQKPKPTRACFWAKPAGQTPTPPTRPGPQKPALYRTAPALVYTEHGVLVQPTSYSWCVAPGIKQKAISGQHILTLM